MNRDLYLTKLLGSVSLCLGVTQLLAGKRIRNALGLPVPPILVMATGLREIASGFVVLAHPDETLPIGVRIAGDVIDLAVLGAALLPGNRRRPAALLATVAVAGITVLDLAAGGVMRQRQARVTETARRTRVKAIKDASMAS